MLWYARSLEIAACPQQSSRIRGAGHRRNATAALDVVMEKIDQWEQEDPLSDGLEMIDDSRLRGSRPCRHMGGHLTNGVWRTEVAHVVARHFKQTPTLHSQRAQPSTLWCRLYLEVRIGRGLTRIARVLGVKPRAVSAACVPASHGASWRRTGGGRKWRERPRVFCRWCGTGQGEVVHAKIHHLPSPFRGRSLHSDPWREGLRTSSRGYGG